MKLHSPMKAVISLAKHLDTSSTSILACICVESAHELSLQNDEFQLKSEMASISMVDEFAKHARLQRKLIKVQQELKTEVNSRMSSYVKTKFIVSYSTQVLIGIVLLMVAWVYRSTPVAVLPAHWLSPLGPLLSWPTGMDGAIGIAFWLPLLETATRITAATFTA